MKYSEAFGKLGRWAFGQRAIHDLVIHPLMAITGYANWTVKLHDYQAFAALHTDEKLVGITGPRDEVESILSRLGVSDEQVRHFHQDGMMCFGTIETPKDKEEFRKERKRRCPKCRIGSTFGIYRDGEPARECGNCGTIYDPKTGDILGDEG